MPKREPLQAEDHLQNAEASLHRARQYLLRMSELTESVRRLKSAPRVQASSGQYSFQINNEDDRQE